MEGIRSRSGGRKLRAKATRRKAVAPENTAIIGATEKFVEQLECVFRQHAVMMTAAVAFTAEDRKRREQGVNLSALEDARLGVLQQKNGSVVVPYLIKILAYLGELEVQAEGATGPIAEQLAHLRARQQGLYSEGEKLAVQCRELRRNAEALGLDDPRLTVLRIAAAGRQDDLLTRIKAGAALQLALTTTDNESNLPSSPASYTGNAMANYSDDVRALLSGNIPEALRPRLYTKRKEPPPPEAVSEANRIMNTYKRRKKKGQQFSEAEMETMRRAGRVLSADTKHKKIAKARERTLTLS